jgi:hypothetical protein
MLLKSDRDCSANEGWLLEGPVGGDIEARRMARSETYNSLVNFQNHSAKGRYGTEAPRDSWSVVMQQQAGDGGRPALRVVGLGVGDSANQDAEPELRSSGNTQRKRLLQLHTRGMARQGR